MPQAPPTVLQVNLWKKRNPITAVRAEPNFDRNIAYSTSDYTNSSAPNGSVLGPTLFLLFIDFCETVITLLFYR